MKSFLIVSLLFLSSCFQSKFDSTRSLASIEGSTCGDLFSSIVKRDINDKVDDDLQMYIYKSAKDYSRWHNNVTFSRSLTFLLQRTRKRLIRTFSNWNRNKIPVIYINDEDETLSSVSKLGDIYSRNIEVDSFKGKSSALINPTTGSRSSSTTRKTRALTKEQNDIIAYDLAWTRLNQWFDRYEKYPESMGTLFREYSSLVYNIDKIDKINVGNGTTETFDIFDDIYDETGKIFLRRDFKKVVMSFSNDQELKKFRLELKDRLHVIRKGNILVSGSQRALELEQAKLLRRINFFLKKVEPSFLSAEANDITIRPELLQAYSKARELVANPEFAPSPNIIIKLEGYEINKEFVDLFKNIKESNTVDEIKKIYDTLDENEKELLELDEKGRITSLFRLVSNNRWVIFAMSSVGGSITFQEKISETLLNLWVAIRSDDRIQANCIREEKDDDFYSCMETYLIEKFKLSHPFSYFTSGYEGLVNALKDDKEKADELVAIVESMGIARAKYIENEEKAAEFKSIFTGMIEDIVKGRDSDKESDNENVTPRNNLFFNLVE